jgi:hypothetical protein
MSLKRLVIRYQLDEVLVLGAIDSIGQ